MIHGSFYAIDVFPLGVFSICNFNLHNLMGNGNVNINSGIESFRCFGHCSPAQDARFAGNNIARPASNHHKPAWTSNQFILLLDGVRRGILILDLVIYLYREV